MQILKRLRKEKDTVDVGQVKADARQVLGVIRMSSVFHCSMPRQVLKERTGLTEERFDRTVEMLHGKASFRDGEQVQFNKFLLFGCQHCMSNWRGADGKPICKTNGRSLIWIDPRMLCAACVPWDLKDVLL